MKALCGTYCKTLTMYLGQELLQELLPLEDAELRSWLPANRDRLSLDFLLWLVDRCQLLG